MFCWGGDWLGWGCDSEQSYPATGEECGTRIYSSRRMFRVHVTFARRGVRLHMYMYVMSHYSLLALSLKSTCTCTSRTFRRYVQHTHKIVYTSKHSMSTCPQWGTYTCTIHAHVYMCVFEPTVYKSVVLGLIHTCTCTHVKCTCTCTCICICSANIRYTCIHIYTCLLCLCYCNHIISMYMYMYIPWQEERRERGMMAGGRGRCRRATPPLHH